MQKSWIAGAGICAIVAGGLSVFKACTPELTTKQTARKGEVSLIPGSSAELWIPDSQGLSVEIFNVKGWGVGLRGAVPNNQCTHVLNFLAKVALAQFTLCAYCLHPAASSIRAHWHWEGK